MGGENEHENGKLRVKRQELVVRPGSLVTYILIQGVHVLRERNEKKFLIIKPLIRRVTKDGNGNVYVWAPHQICSLLGAESNLRFFSQKGSAKQVALGCVYLVGPSLVFHLSLMTDSDCELFPELIITLRMLVYVLFIYLIDRGEPGNSTHTHQCFWSLGKKLDFLLLIYSFTLGD